MTLRVVSFAIAGCVLAGCENHAEIHDGVISRLHCKWAERLGACFCTATKTHRGYATWAPADVCRMGE